MLYSNESSGENVSFKYYSHSNNEVYDIGQSLEFINDMTLGNLITPEEFSISTTVDIAIDFSSGWSWFSINVVGDDMSINGVLSQTGAGGDYIKSQGGYADFYAGFGWGGTLFDIDPKQGYKLRLADSSSLSYTGMPIDPSANPIDLSAGWNWIGYLPSNALDINTALNVGEGGDYIKGQGGYADFYAGFGWGGTLFNLSPSEMYMLRLSSSATLTYPGGSSLLMSSTHNNVKDIPESVKDFDYRSYEFNGSITSTINIDDVIVSDSDYIVAYDSKGEVVGYTHPRVFELTDDYVFFLMVYGNESIGNKMNFEYYNSYLNKTYELDQDMNFESDMTVGNGLDPVLFNNSNAEIVSGLSIESAYPNPFNPSTNIEYTISNAGLVEILVYDIMGRQVGEIFNEYESAGEHKVTWDAVNYASGIYYIQIKANQDVQTQKVMLLK
jgi:hypothetical protein